MSGFLIGDRHVGDGAPCLIVAEVAQAHEGSVRIAHDFIDAVAKAGADACKFQLHLAAHESTPDEPWRVPPKWPQDYSRHDYWVRTCFLPDEWHGLQEHCDDVGLLFLCSPFSVEAVEWLDPLVPAWKVPSGEIANEPLLEALAATRKPIMISTGMATRLETARALSVASRWASPTALLQCTSEYPTPPERIGLGALADLRGWTWEPTVGLSDHSGTPWAGIAAVALGAAIVEVHVKLSEHDSGFDAAASLTIADLSRMVEGIRFVERALVPIDKDEMARSLQPIRDLFMGRAKRKAEHDAKRTA